ncbi:MAG: hypothetical protein J7K00_04790 [Candidatus Diapherotrites archaeon]|nr:hypothetical protein [Candidatus Diapherotrites archaeon]
MVYQNPDKDTLTIVFDGKGKSLKGMVVMFNKIYTVVGDVQHFASAIKRDIIIVEKHTQDKSFKFAVIPAYPKYVGLESEELSNAVQEMNKDLESISVSIKEIGKAYNIEFTSLKEAGKAAEMQFYSEPLMIVASAAVRSATDTGAYPASIKGTKSKIIAGEFVFGLTSDSTIAKISVQSLLKAVISGSLKSNRAAVTQVIAEGSLLNNVPALIFDMDAEFKGISLPSNDTSKFAESKIDLEPIGFPTKKFVAGKDIHVDLNLLPKGVFSQAFNLGDNEAANLIEETIFESKGSITSVKEIFDKLQRKQGNRFQINRAVRFLKVIEKSNENAFGGKNQVDDIIGGWRGSMGRVSHVDLSDYSTEVGVLMVYSVLEIVLQKFKKENHSKSIGGVVVIPHSELMFGENPTVMQSEFIKLSGECQNYGLGCCYLAETRHHLDRSMVESSTLDIEVIAEREVAVKEVAGRPYRVKVRPTLSRFEK